MKKFLKIFLIIILITGFAIFLLWLLNPGERESTNENFIRTVREFIPFGNSNDIIIDETPTEPSNEFFSGGEAIVDGKRSLTANLPDLEQITPRQVAGFMVYGTSSPIVRFVLKENGHIIDINTVTQEEKRLSNVTIPGIQRASFIENGNTVVLQYTQENSDIVETLVIENIGRESQTSGTYLEENIISLYPEESGQIIYNVRHNVGSRIKAYTVSNKSLRTLTDIPLHDVEIIGISNRYIYTQTKPTYTSVGYLLRISKTGGDLERIYEGIEGSSYIMSDSTDTIFSTHGTVNSTSINRTSGELINFNLKTIASKCVFDNEDIYCGIPQAMSGNTPDSWFMGLTTFTDSLWKIETPSGNATKIIDLDNIDSIDIEVYDTIVVLKNKKDNSLWVVRPDRI